MKRFNCLTFTMLNPAIAVGDVSINVIEKFEAMYHTVDRGIDQWESGVNGSVSLGLLA